MKISKNHTFIFLIISSIFAVTPSCAPKPKGLEPLDHDRFIDVYVAALDRRALPSVTKDSTHRVSLDSVLARYGTNRAQFWVTVESYRTKPEQWRQFFAEVSQKLEKKIAEEGNSKGSAGPH